MSLFAPRHARDVARLIESEVLGIVTTHDAQGYIATPLPLLVTCDDQSDVCEFVGHFARGNPHFIRAQQSPVAQITFLGPHGYIGPAMVSKPGWAPTWNYQFAQFEVEIEFQPDQNDAAIRALVERMEGSGNDAWSVEQVGERYARMVKNVVAFRAIVRTQAARFKLGQDEDRPSFDEIIASLGKDPLVQPMLEQRAV
jgi:transcriptional regulator